MKFTGFLSSFIMILIFNSCFMQEETVLLVHNINGYTFAEGSFTGFGALAVSGSKVVTTGSEDELRDRFPDAEFYDGKGLTLLPGLIDAHSHVMGLGFSHLNVNLAGTTSLNETLDRVREYAAEHPEVAWIRGRGWNQTHWPENEFPTAADLDAVISDRPAWLVRIDGHAGWANSLALEKAGITAETPDPSGGQILRDENGQPAGVLIDAAMIDEVIPAPGEEERRAALTKALKELASAGLTSVHDARTGPEDFDLYREFARAGQLTARMYAMIDGTGAIFDRMSAGGPQSLHDDRLVLRSVKISTDGALGSRGAALLEPYDDDPGNEGLLFYDTDELASKIEKASQNGFQVNIHAIGDKANRQVLDAFESVFRRSGGSELRHRIEHAQVVHPADIPRFKELDVIASMQPTHATSDMNMAEDRVGPERIKGAYAWRTFLDQGTRIAAGSDFPVEQSNPFHGWYSAVVRADFDGNPSGGWYPHQAMNREEVFRAFTVDAAYAAHQEKVTGSLEPGKWADFILVDRDPFHVPDDELWQVRVLETWLAGERIYRREN